MSRFLDLEAEGSDEDDISFTEYDLSGLSQVRNNEIEIKNNNEIVGDIEQQELSNNIDEDDKGRGPQSKYWCWTIFGPARPYTDDCSFAVYQREVCPETGREHWQGYCEFPTKRYRKSVQRILNCGKIHIDLRRGSQQDAIKYCTKQDTRKPGTQPYMVGKPSEEGASNDFELAVRAISEGKSVVEIATKHPKTFVRYFKGIERLIALRGAQEPHEFRPMSVGVLWGPTGTGKSRYIVDWCAMLKKSVYRKSYSKGFQSWWDGYIGQEVLHIDDFEGESAIEELLTLLDGYGHNKEWQVKGGTVRISAKYCFFTSNSDPNNWYKDLPQTKQSALLRRLGKIYNMQISTTYALQPYLLY